MNEEQNKIEIFRSTDNQVSVEVKFDEETVWLSQLQMANLFGRDRKTITRHISNIFNEKELDEKVVCSFFEHTTQHGAISGKTQTQQIKLYNDYIAFINEIYSDFESDVFAKPKDQSFHSSIHQIAQTFDGAELYPSIQEKAANLLYYVVKNHSFVDGNKRIAAVCFLYFLDKNKALIKQNRETIISNEALAALTLFIAISKTDEADTVKRFIISILNRNMNQIQSVEL
ncbi:MAG: type II toxin-antitoxin system death-on-curing family toxin [Prolixibacteraceae bacterium]|jgi:death-on-curing family protein|nr:type II toxin-antitoxin system death-on-curing family toxin [Prolixibacteraceae bacterium]